MALIHTLTLSFACASVFRHFCCVFPCLSSGLWGEFLIVALSFTMLISVPFDAPSFTDAPFFLFLDTHFVQCCTGFIDRIDRLFWWKFCRCRPSSGLVSTVDIDINLIYLVGVGVDRRCRPEFLLGVGVDRRYRPSGVDRVDIFVHMCRHVSSRGAGVGIESRTIPPSLPKKM